MFWLGSCRAKYQNKGNFGLGIRKNEIALYEKMKKLKKP